MPDHRAGWGDLLRAAFSFRVPIKGLGGFPLNYLCLAAGGVFAFLFLLGQNVTAAAGVILLTSAFELGYLYVLTSMPVFRRIVDADVAGQAQAAVAHVHEASASRLSRPGQQRYDHVLATCDEIERLLGERFEGEGQSWVDSLKTGGLEELKAMAARLLWHQERLGNYLSFRQAENLPAQIRAMQNELRHTELSAAVKQAKEKTIEVLQQRQTQVEHMVETLELAKAEMDRLEQHLSLLRDQAVGGENIQDVVGQIDGAVEGINDTSSWLVDSERMLGDDATTAATQSVDAS